MGKHNKKQGKEKVNKYDNLSKPQAELDFHNRGALTQGQMKEILDEFIEDCRERGLYKVLIITGKGLHSKKGMPIIKPFVKKYLQDKHFVARVYEGRFDRGGSGTLEVVFN